MCSKPDDANQLEPNSHVIPLSAVCSQPWWHGVGYNAAPTGILGESASKSAVDQPGSDMETKTSQSQGDGGHEGEDVSKEVPISSMPQTGTDGNYGPQNQHMQQVASTMAPSGGEYVTTHPQLELVGHSIACAPYPYSDPYYGGLMTAYGTQALVNPHLIGMHHSRMPLPLQMTEEPVYVNAKQYHGIIRRRESRAKAELEKKLIKVRKPYLHESRHQHAMRRARGCGGRFLNTKKLQEGENSNPEKGMDSGAESTTQSRGPSGSETNGFQEVKGFNRQDMHEQLMHANGNGNGNGSYQHHQGFRMSAYHSLSSERGEEGDCSGQQRGSISVNQARHRALAIQ